MERLWPARARLACSLIQSRAHFTVSAQDGAALAHQDGELHVGDGLSRLVWTISVCNGSFIGQVMQLCEGKICLQRSDSCLDSDDGGINLIGLHVENSFRFRVGSLGPSSDWSGISWGTETGSTAGTREMLCGEHGEPGESREQNNLCVAV